MDSCPSDDLRYMRQALRLAALGQGLVEPNPMVGCVIVRDDQVVGEGWHQQFGAAHAEIAALLAAGKRTDGGTMYVTLEPCCHQGKTPPCTERVIAAGIRRVVVAQQDPFGQVCGQGIARLRAAGLEVEVGLQQLAAERLNAPYLKRIRSSLPWIIAKWAMTLDGKLASRTGHSQWISSEPSRQVVHQLRGRVDAILVGSQTARSDDPALTARPPGPRIAHRVVVDSAASLPVTSQLARTAYATPVIVAVGSQADATARDQLVETGCEVIVCEGAHHLDRLLDLLKKLAQRDFTNVLVEGGGRLFGNLLQLGQIDEVHAFIAPRLVGGHDAISPIEGVGFDSIEQAMVLDQPKIQSLGDDIYVTGRVLRDDMRGAEPS